MTSILTSTGAADLSLPPAMTEPFALSSVQEVVWFDQMRQPHSPAYNIGLAWRIDGPVDAALFTRAINLAAAAHDGLRLVLCPGPGVARQKILEQVEVPVSVVDFSGHADGDARAMAYLAQRFAEPFDLDAGLLWEAGLVRASAGHCYWLSRHHHLVTDGFGTALLTQAVAAAYNALAAGGDGRLARAPSYRDFVADDQDYMRSARFARDCEFWRARYATLPAPLIARRAGAPTTAGPGARARWSVPRDLFDSLTGFAAASGHTFAHLLMAGISTYFARTRDVEEVVIGVPVHNRASLRQKQTIGMFSSVSPIGIRVDPESTLTDIMRTAAAELKRCYRHQRLPLARINREIKLAASGRSQLFDITVSPITFSGDAFFGDAATRVIAIDSGAENMPLAVAIRDHHREGDVMVDFNVNTDVVDEQTAGAICASVAALLQDALAHPALPVSRLNLLSDAERRQLAGFNDTAMPYPDTAVVHELFEALAAAQPDAVALVSETVTLTYGQLNGRANTLAARLAALGVGPDRRVAICVERGVEMIVGVLGVLKAGGAYVPLDPAYPPERLAYMLADSAPLAVLTQEALAPQCAALAPALPLLALDTPQMLVGTARNPHVSDLTPEHPAYVIYTSGSTGQPKGVMVRHASLCNFVTVQQALFENRPGSRVLQFASFSFDASVWEMTMALCSGAALHLAAREQLRPGAPLLQTLRERAITHLLLPSSALALLDDPEALQPMTLLVGGDACPPALAAKWSARHRFYNAYGPTEATVCVTFHRCQPWHTGPVPLGSPIANTQIHLLDQHLQLVPLGAVGEICVGGAAVARGYLNREALTEERFAPDPFTPGARMYRTGDVGRWRADGNLEYLGRNDFQVKLRGFRIELGEIETALTACRGVSDALVVAREDQPGDKRLVAYLIAGAGAAPTAGELRAQLSETLPDYMLPSAFVTLASWPLGGNGKLDRKALPTPGMEAVAARAYAAPEGALETAIAAIWQELLGLPQVGRSDHFFELGGHSLMATQVISMVQQRLGIVAGLGAIFGRPTLAGFAAAVAAAGEQEQEQHGIMPAGRDAVLPLSFAQQGMWFLDRLDPAASAAYHMPAALRLYGKLDRAALQSTLDRIIARHDNLRTRFVGHDGQPSVRIAAPDCGCSLAWSDLSHLPRAERETVLAQCQREEARAPFDLATGPMMRAQLIRMDDLEHVLLLTQHHIVSDGWSVQVLVTEMSALYAAFVHGQPDPLPALPIQYADYAVWQRRHLQGALLERQLAFWKQHLDGAPALLELPADRPRPAWQSYAGARVPFTLGADLSAAVKALGARHGTTVFMTLLAGWSLLLARLSGQHDVVVGVPVANRQRAEVADLTGLFVNTLALRVRPGMDTTVADLLAQVKATTTQAYQHQDLPFEQVVDALQPARSMRHSPLFQVVLNIEATGVLEQLSMPGLRLEPLATPLASTHFDLSLLLSEHDGMIGGTLEYASDLFDGATIARMAAQLREVLSAMVANEHETLGRVPLLGPAERTALLEGFNDTARACPTHKLVHRMFEDQVTARPDALALIAGARRLTYAELNRRANRVAHELRALGVGPDQHVAICAARGVELIVGLLGILKAGAAYVPLDPDCPTERLAFILADCAPAAVLAEASLWARLPALSMPQLTLGSADRTTGADSNPDPDAIGLAAHHLANIIYTSGSTGQPKGVMVEHRNVIQLVIDEPCVAIGPEDRIVYCANPAFDASTWEIWGGLLNGATVLVVDQATLLDPAAFGRMLVDDGATILQLTAGLFTQYADLCADAFPRLDYLLFGGDQANPRTVDRVFSTCAPRHLVHTYGPTETTTFTSTFEVTRALVPGVALPIGRPIANTRIYVLDAFLQPVPPGVSGELYIGGAGVARGYLNRPELTAERFVADPFSAVPGSRLYRTGDLGRWLADGNIEFLGRNDFQVKIRGFRIELGEIEAKLARCAGVHEAVVLARAGADDEKCLVAYLIAQPGAMLSAAALRATLAESLADYMLPSAFVVLDAYPLTPNGKLDRQALPAPDLAAHAGADYAPPRAGIESDLAGVWEQLLGMSGVGRHDHFFRLGGHSLMAVRLMSRLREQLGVELGLRELFAEPTLAGFASLIASAREAQAGTIAPADRAAPLALSFAQQRLWFLDRLDAAAGAAYHMPAALRLRGPLDASALKAALDRLVLRHEALRTTFTQDGGETMQCVAPAGGGFALAERDLGALSGSEQQAMVDMISTDEAIQPFDLASGPLIRGQLLRLAGNEHVLLITQHHIISDGWSVSVLVHELSTLYAAFAAGLPDPLPPLPIQYADYAAWQRGWLQGERLQVQVDFWRDHLTGAPALLELPTDHPRPAVQSYAGGTVPVVLAGALAAGVRALAERHGATLFVTLMAGWSILLARMAGQEEVVIGTPVANRQRSEVEGLIGFFANTLALRVRLGQQPTVAQLLAQVKADTLAACEHQDLPFEQVVEALQPVRSMSHSPLFQAVLIVASAAGEPDFTLTGLDVSRIEQRHTSTHFDLTLQLTDDRNTISGVLEYASDLFDEVTVRRIAANFACVLGAMVADEHQPVSRLNLLSDAERRQLAGFNDTAMPYPDTAVVHELFEALAAAQPDAVALVSDTVTLTYGQLNGRANTLAARLAALGVGPDRRVAICVERGVEMIVGVLGVLKAGGAYVPFDPAYPPERLAYMLADSTPLALLTQEALATQCAALAPALPLLVLDAPQMEVETAGNPHVSDLTPEHPAYIIYTSGSTGQPKGVIVRHASLCNFATAQQALFDHGPGNRVLQFASFSFDASVWEMTMALCSGAALHLAAREQLRPGAPLLQTLRERAITHLMLPSSALTLWSDPNALAPMTLLVAGETCPPALAAKWSARHRFYNAYGPTETTVCVTFYRCQPGHTGPVPLGPPIANTQIHLLDRHLQLVPLGAVGEICVGGAGVGRGYLNREALTAERFVPDPFTAGGRLYHTGDLGRWRADGNLEYLGRNDFQVKLRGFRIELGEIETALTACRGVSDALVVAREDQPGDKRLVAYLIAGAGAAPTAGELRAQLSETLPDYMLPSAFVTLASWPLGGNGKLDRKALPTPGMEAVAARAYAAPESELETAIAGIWQELLGLPQVGRSDHFFELGGHSLMAVRLLARMREQCLVDVPLRTLFAAPVLSELAIEVRALQFESFMPASLASLTDALDELSEAELIALLDEERQDPA